MNKNTKSIKELKEKLTLEIGPPSECAVCGYTAEQMKKEFEVAWLEHRIPNTSFVFYMCPNCNICSGNRFSTENAKKIATQQKEGESRILQPQKSIILPGKN